MLESDLLGDTQYCRDRASEPENAQEPFLVKQCRDATELFPALQSITSAQRSIATRGTFRPRGYVKGDGIDRLDKKRVNRHNRLTKYWHAGSKGRCEYRY